MPKLATPILYDPSLEGLNEIRPLQLAEVSKIVIPYPILATDSLDSGKLVRCNNAGAILKANNTKYKYVEIFAHNYSYPEPNHCFTFSQEVSCVLAMVHYVLDCDSFFWTNPDYTENIQEIELPILPAITLTPLSFKGINLYTRSDFTIMLGSLYTFFLGYF